MAFVSEDNMKLLKAIALLLVIIGALNWGAEAILGVDLVRLATREEKTLENFTIDRAVKTVIALAGVGLAVDMFTQKK